MENEPIEKDLQDDAGQKETIERAFEQTVEEGQQAADANPWSGFTPSKFGLDSRYDKMSPEQFAKEYQFRNQTFGRQSQELGELRRKTQEYEAKLSRFMEAADKPVEMKKASQGMDELTKENFYKLLERGEPDKAFDLMLKDKLTPRYDEDESFQKAVDARVQEHLSKYYNYTMEEGLRQDPDYPKYSDYIELLSQEDHFGGQRNPKELLKFAKLVDENKPLADLTYHNMRKYKDMPFDEAKQYAMAMMNSQSATHQKQEAIAKQVKSLSGVSPATGSAQQASQTETIKSMDDAFTL